MISQWNIMSIIYFTIPNRITQIREFLPTTLQKGVQSLQERTLKIKHDIESILSVRNSLCSKLLRKLYII